MIFPSLVLILLTSYTIAEDVTNPIPSSVLDIPGYVSVRLGCESQKHDCAELADEYGNTKLFKKYCTTHYEDGILIGFQPCLEICEEKSVGEYSNQCLLECPDFVEECLQFASTTEPPNVKQQRNWTEEECCTASDEMCMSGCELMCYVDTDYDSPNRNNNVSCYEICRPTSGKSNDILKCQHQCKGYLDNCSRFLTTTAHTVTLKRQWTTEECCTASDDMCNDIGCENLCFSYFDFYDNQLKNASCHRICTSGESDDYLQCLNECQEYNATCLEQVKSSEAPSNDTEPALPESEQDDLYGIVIVVILVSTVMGCCFIGSCIVVICRRRYQSTIDRNRGTESEEVSLKPKEDDSNGEETTL